MPCTDLPAPTIPTPPLGISITPPPLPFVGDLDLCCKIVSLSALTSILPLPPLIFNPAVAAVLEAQLALLLAYKNALPISCPKE